MLWKVVMRCLQPVEDAITRGEVGLKKGEEGGEGGGLWVTVELYGLVYDSSEWN